MTVTLNRDEGSEEKPAVIRVGAAAAAKRAPAAKVAGKPRSNADCLSSADAGGGGGGTRDGIGVGAAGKRSRSNAGGIAPGGDTVAGAGQTTAFGASARQFLRRYHHHIAFRRLSPPVTYTETVEMPVPLYPTCLDVCGCMVAVGTREGPVLLFDVGPRPSGATPLLSEGGTMPRAVGTAAPAAAAAAAASASFELGGSTGRDNGGRGIRRGGTSPAHVANAARAATSISTTSGGAVGDGGSNNTSSSPVTRVYGSLADGTGPISSVILDRAKVIAAGRGSRRSGSGYVVRIYAVDSTRLLRTLRCAGEVSRMCLFDPVLAVLSSGVSGRLSFRDLYADGGSGLGQRTAPGVSAVAFAAVERQNNSSRNSDNRNHDGQSGDIDNEALVVLHCVDSSGTMLEASTFGVVWNVERDSSGPPEDAAPAQAAAAGRGWHVCADLEASLLIRATPWRTVSGWRLHASGRRARGPIFRFRLGATSVSRFTPVVRCPTSVALAAGGLILATAGEGTAPKLWDLRLARRSQRWTLASSPSEAAFAEGLGPREAGGSAASERGGGGSESGGARVEDANGSSGGVRGGTQPRAREVRPWPAGAWAVGVAVDAGSGRLVSVCSDGRMRITKLRSNNEEARLRAAVLLARQAKHAVTPRSEAP